MTSQYCNNGAPVDASFTCNLCALPRPIVVMRLRKQMCASDNEHQLKYLVYMLEQASKLAEKTGLLKVQADCTTPDLQQAFQS